MAINLTPNSTPDDIPGVVEIIKLLSDADAYNQRLAEIRGIAASADSKLADANALAAKYASATTMVADATKLLNDHKRRNDELSHRINAANAQERDLAKAQAQHGEHVTATAAAHDGREAALATRENEADTRAAELAALEQSLNDREAAIALREAKMKEIVRSFPE